MRISAIDGLRGIFLLFMCIVHLNDLLGVTLGKLNHHYFGWVEDAQGFVFISGVVVGMVYGRRLLRSGPEAMRRAVLARTATIFSHQVALIALLLAGALTLGAVYGSAPIMLAGYWQDPAAFTLNSLVLLTGSPNMGILPMYVFFMLATPWALRRFEAGQDVFVLVVSAGLWLLMQLDLAQLATTSAVAAANEAGVPLRVGLFFNVFAWQALFFAGLWFGFRAGRGDLSLEFLRAPALLPVAGTCFALFLILGVFDRVVFNELVSAEFSRSVLASVSRQDLSPIYAAAFVVDLFLLAWLLTAGPTCGVAWVVRVASVAHGILSWPPLVGLGRHSLHLFSYHILLFYAVDAALFIRGTPFSELQGSAVLVAGAASLFLVAASREALLRRDRAVART